MAGKAKQTVKTRQKKIPDSAVQCNICKGRGYVKKGYNKKKS